MIRTERVLLGKVIAGGVALVVLGLLPVGMGDARGVLPLLGRAALAADAAKVDINGSSEKELEKLPGIGKATAKKIVAGRPYASVGDLKKAGVSDKTIEKITPMVSVGAAPAAAAKPAPPEKAAAMPEKKASAPAATGGQSTGAATATAPAKAAVPEAKAPPAKGMVWVNTKSGVFHHEGDRWYGKTKEGKYMTEGDAIKAGYRASKEGAAKQ